MAHLAKMYLCWYFQMTKIENKTKTSDSMNSAVEIPFENSISSSWEKSKTAFQTLVNDALCMYLYL